MGKNFIVTFDKETAEKLEKEGFMLIDDREGRYMFLNEGPLHFSEKDNKHIVYTDLLPT